jgi:hypothetical protein
MHYQITLTMELILEFTLNDIQNVTIPTSVEHLLMSAQASQLPPFPNCCQYSSTANFQCVNCETATLHNMYPIFLQEEHQVMLLIKQLKRNSMH